MVLSELLNQVSIIRYLQVKAGYAVFLRSHFSAMVRGSLCVYSLKCMFQIYSWFNRAIADEACLYYVGGKILRHEN